MDPDAFIEKLKNESMMRLYLGVMVFLGLTAGLVFYIQHESYKIPPMDQCTSELQSTKRQLEVETEYKNRIEKMLSDTQEYYEADKEQFKTSMETCFAMTQQSFLCQNQMNDLHIKCNKVRSDYEKASRELEEIKCSKNPA
ncbi:uncharacterized protein LOC115455215 [Manduca sexta]|uniref:Uncharacterized protein n=1 Tax=Manduca sexta TaxID=7130 RepID=A0A921YNZ9_MANSE|nr:uncharacterized protein LOC115455215 [Manduca sexta]KAG6442843.1 hypothetical protein O3G_MSEX002505 [Manduca sexta]